MMKNQYIFFFIEKLTMETDQVQGPKKRANSKASSETQVPTSGDDAIFSGESLLQKLKSPWELILTEPVPEVVEFRPSD